MAVCTLICLSRILATNPSWLLPVISDLRFGPYPQVILKFRPHSSLDYIAYHGPQTVSCRENIVPHFWPKKKRQNMKRSETFSQTQCAF